MKVLVKFTIVGGDAGPFNLYTNVDGFTAAFATGVTSAQLLAGYPSGEISDATTVIRVKSIGVCDTIVDLAVPGITTTTTSSSSTSSTTTSTTVITTTLPLAYPVVDSCCGLTSGTHYVNAPNGTFVPGNVFTSTSMGYFGAFMVTGPREPGIADIVRFDGVIYGSCLEWSAFYPGGTTCV